VAEPRGNMLRKGYYTAFDRPDADEGGFGYRRQVSGMSLCPVRSCSALDFQVSRPFRLQPLSFADGLVA
jgi:hypothetical protein